MIRRQVLVYYSGRVQGVGFRYTVKTVAKGYEVVGYVRNLADGRVELLAQGQETELGEFLQAIRDSGLSRFIRHEDPSWGGVDRELRGFEIEHGMQ